MSVKLTFWVRPSQKNAKDLAPIYLRIQYDNQRSQYSIGEYITLNQWDKKRQQVKGTSVEARAMNSKLEALKAKALKTCNELLLSGLPFNAFIIKDKLVNGLSKSITFDELMNECIDKMIALKGKSYSQPTIVKYRNTQLRVRQYVKKKYRRNHVFLYELDYDFIDGFDTFLKTEFSNSNTTSAKHYQRISKCLHTAINKGYLNKYPFSEYKPKIDKTALVYLTYEEIQKIEAKSFTVQRLEMVRKIFLFTCYSGLSFKEMENLKPENIITSDGQTYWISMVRQKTKKPYKVVLLPQAYQLIQDLQVYKDNIKKGMLLPLISNQKYNTYLKELADNCGIPKTLTSHVGRKSFSIGVALRSSVSIELLSALLGHQSIRSTLNHYYALSEESMINGVKNLAEQLEKLK